MPSEPGEKLGIVCESSRAGEDPWLCLGFSLICLSCHQVYERTEKMSYFLSIKDM